MVGAEAVAICGLAHLNRELGWLAYGPSFAYSYSVMGGVDVSVSPMTVAFYHILGMTALISGDHQLAFSYLKCASTWVIQRPIATGPIVAGFIWSSVFHSGLAAKFINRLDDVMRAIALLDKNVDSIEYLREIAPDQRIMFYARLNELRGS